MSDRKLTASVIHDGRKYPLVLSRGLWRIRSRSRTHPLDVSLGIADLRVAKREALKILDGRAKARPSAVTLEDLVSIYLATPKRTTDYAARVNVSRLRALVRVAKHAELAEVSISELGPDLWTGYQIERQGGRLDLTTRNPENVKINAAVRQARAIIAEKLHAAYRAAGVRLPTDALAVTWLPEPKRILKPSCDDPRMIEAWRDLPPGPLRLAIGLARFAGLRRAEIEAMRTSWLLTEGQGTSIELCDRPDEGFYSKTGEAYAAPILDADFAAELQALPEGRVIDMPPRWFKRTPQAWAKQWTGTAKKPLHRLRGLYADDLAAITRNAVLARLEGVKAAASALGHTNDATTRNHYLSDALR